MRAVWVEAGAVDRVSGELPNGQRLVGRELELFNYLVDRAPEPVSRDELLTQVWQYSPSARSRATDFTMRRLRLKVELDPSQPRHLLSVPGVGYRFVPLDQHGALGRARELVELRELCRGHPVVAVVGPPGVGKSTLVAALETLRVDVDGVDDLDAARRRVLSALGVETGDIAALLATRSQRLLLDGAEGLVQHVVDVLSWSPLVLTSRVSFPQVPQLTLRPLGLEDATQLAMRHGAGPAEAEVLARRLGGLPLAIQLVARQVPTLGAPTVLALLDRHLDLAPGLRGAIQLSWDRLSPDGRRALATASIFNRAFSADELLGTDPTLPAASLVELGQAHLLQPTPHGLLCLESVRALAREHLGDQEASIRAAWQVHVRRTTRELMDRFAQQGRSEDFDALGRLRPDSVRALEALEREDPHAAADFLRTFDQPPLVVNWPAVRDVRLRLAARLQRPELAVAGASPPESAIEAACRSEDPLVRWTGIRQRARSLRSQGRRAEALEVARTGLSAGAGLSPGAQALSLAMVASLTPDDLEAEDLAARALAVVEPGWRALRGSIVLNLGNRAARAARYEDALALFREAADLLQGSRLTQRHHALAHGLLVELAMDRDRADALREQIAVLHARQSDNHAALRIQLGAWLIQRNRVDQGAQDIREGLRGLIVRTSRELGHFWLAVAAYVRGDHILAADRLADVPADGPLQQMRAALTVLLEGGVPEFEPRTHVEWGFAIWRRNQNAPGA